MMVFVLRIWKLSTQFFQSTLFAKNLRLEIVVVSLLVESRIKGLGSAKANKYPLDKIAQKMAQLLSRFSQTLLGTKFSSLYIAYRNYSSPTF